MLTKNSHSLPGDVFVDGEIRPVKKKKKTKAVDKKRSADTAGLNVSVGVVLHSSLRDGTSLVPAMLNDCLTADIPLIRRMTTLVLLSAHKMALRQEHWPRRTVP